MCKNHCFTYNIAPFAALSEPFKKEYSSYMWQSPGYDFHSYPDWGCKFASTTIVVAILTVSLKFGTVFFSVNVFPTVENLKYNRHNSVGNPTAVLHTVNGCSEMQPSVQTNRTHQRVNYTIYCDLLEKGLPIHLPAIDDQVGTGYLMLVMDASTGPAPAGTLIERFKVQGADRTQVGPMLAPWTLLSGQL